MAEERNEEINGEIEMMQVCYNNHSEIVYDEKNCPLCEAIRNIKEIIKLKDKLEDDVGELEKAVLILQANDGQFKTLIAHLENKVDVLETRNVELDKENEILQNEVKEYQDKLKGWS